MLYKEFRHVTEVQAPLPLQDSRETNVNFLLTILIRNQEIRLWEFKNDHLR